MKYFEDCANEPLMRQEDLGSGQWIMGLDLGSVSVNFVLLDQEGTVKEER